MRQTLGTPLASLEALRSDSSVERARVLALIGAHRLRLALASGEREAVLAVDATGVRPGDEVLCITTSDGASFVIGVIHAPRPCSALDEALAAESAVETVRDRAGRLLFEYDSETHKAVLHVPAGDLELSVPAGSLRLRSRDGLSLETDQELTLRGATGIRMSAAADRVRLALSSEGVSLVAGALAVLTDRAEVLAGAVQLRASSLTSHAERVRTIAKLIDTRAGRIVERTRDTYREVENLSQTRAGRLKLVAKRAASLVGESTLLKARKKMKVKGDRIHLG